MMIIILSLFFLLVLLIVSGLIVSVGRTLEKRQLVAKMRGERTSLPLEEIASGLPFVDRYKRHFLNLLRRFGRFSKPRREEEVSRLEKIFASAGYRKRNILLVYLGAKALLALMFPAAFLAVKFLSGTYMAPALLMSLFVLCALAGFYLPDAWLQLALKNRRQRILKGFPDALDLLIVCVESGMSLDSAITRVGEEMKLSNKDISDEFKLLTLEMRAGKSRREALRNFSARSGLEEVNNLVTLLIQTDKFGTSVAQALRVHSDSIRVRRYHKAEELAAKMPVKLLFPLVICIFPSLFLVIMGPALIQVFRLWKG